MSSLQRRVGMLILIALVVQPVILFAQGSAVTVVGSGIPAPLIQAFATAANLNINLNVTGTNQGFETFCQGQADVTLATRAISVDEENSCDNVNFLEFVLGYDIMAVVANPATDFGTCLTTDQLNSLFAPSTTVTNWNQVDTANPDIPLSLNVPPDNSTPYALLDGLVEGVGLRTDLTKLADDAAVINAVSTTTGALGVVSLPDAQAAGDSVTILDLNTTSVGCVSPSAENAAGRSYTASYTLYAYANAAQIDELKPLFTAAFSPDNAASITAQGYVAAPADVQSMDGDILNNLKTGRQFSKDVTAFSIPANLVGTINIAGAATGSVYLTAATGAFVQQYGGVTLNQKFTGEPDGVRQLCNGSMDMITAFSDLTADQQNNCAANNVPTQNIKLGSEAAVLVGSGDFLTCLTTQEITTIWGAASEKTITNWNQVDPSFPDLPLTLLAPTLGNPNADLLMYQASGSDLPTREDVAETKDDPSYRTTAVSNVTGGLTFMSWLEYQALSADVQARATLLPVDAGSGCITPSDQTIQDGSYPLSRMVQLIVNRLSMARPEVQSLLWYIASDAEYPLLASNGFLGISFEQLPDLRDQLQQDFKDAETEAAQAALRTPEPTAEATAQATPETTPSS